MVTLNSEPNSLWVIIPFAAYGSDPESFRDGGRSVTIESCTLLQKAKSAPGLAPALPAT